MIVLDTTTRSLEIDLDGAVAANQLPVLVFWADHVPAAPSYTAGATRSITNSTTAVTILAAPAAATQRIVKYISIKNNDTSPVLLWVQYNDNATLAEIIKVTLAVQDTLEYSDISGWSVIDTTGQKKSIASVTGTVAISGTAAVTQSGTWTVQPGNTANTTAWKVDGSAVTQPVSGTVTANSGTNLNTSALALEAGGNLAAAVTALQIIDNIVAGSEAQVDVLTMPAITGTVTANAGTNLNTSALALEATLDARTGILTETAPVTDTASSGLNGRLQRVAQRLTSLIALLPAALVSGRLDVNLGAAPATVTIGAIPAGTNNIGDVDVLTLPALPAGTNNIGDVDVLTIAAGDNNIGNVDIVTMPAITGTVTANAGTNLNTSALALEATQLTTNTNLGIVTETAPGTDTASSGLNGRLQRIAQRITSLIALLPAALVSGRLDVNIGAAPASLTIGTFPDNEPFNVAQINGVAPLMGNGATGTGSLRVTIANDTTAVPTQGTVAHDAVDSGNPQKVGMKAIAYGTNPTAVAAADLTQWYANRAGIPFVLGGHPNVITIEAAYTAAQTDVAIVTVAGGLKIAVTQIQMTADNANTVDVGFRVGFAAATTPTTTGVVLTHPGVPAGSGISRGDGGAVIGIGADGEDLRITSEVPTTGSIRILVSYFTIES